LGERLRSRFCGLGALLEDFVALDGTFFGGQFQHLRNEANFGVFAFVS
jgi:hypothetical protein